MFFHARRTDAPAAHLEWRVALFVVGAALGLAGIFLDHRGLTGAAILVLAAGVLTRLVRRGRGHGEPDEEEATGPGG